MHHNLSKERREGMAGSVVLLARERGIKKDGMQKQAVKTRGLMERYSFLTCRQAHMQKKEKPMRVI